MVLKGLPRAYNKDLQEDKEALFDSMTTLQASLDIMCGVISTIKANPKRMRKDLFPEMLATDFAEYLVRNGVAFRVAHHISGAAVKLAEDQEKPMSALTFDELKTLHPSIKEDVVKIWNFENSVESRNTPGGTSKSSIERQVTEIWQWIEKEKIVNKKYEIATITTKKMTTED